MNLVYINTHDTGRQISPYGYACPTENFMKLAEESAVFTNAFSCSPTCSPSRAAMLTGMYPHQNGMLGLAQRGFSLYNPEQHLASFLRANGYETAISGIQHEVGWYLDIDVKALNRLGYDTVLTENADSYKKEDLCEWDRKNAEAAAEWIHRDHSDRPFMLAYGMHSTHRPYPETIDSEIDKRYVRPPYPVQDDEGNREDHAKFLTSVKNADENLEIIIKALKESGQYENTVILYTTDHGVAVPYNKCFLNDTGIGVGLIIRVPNSQSQGKVSDALLSQIDIFPTLCDLLKINKPDYLEGKSFASYFETGVCTADSEVYGEINFHTSYEPCRSVRTERYQYIRYFDLNWDKINLSNLDESNPKTELMENGLQTKKKDMECLYDLLYDPGERNNLVHDESMKSQLETMRNSLKEHMIQTSDPLLNGQIEIKAGYKVNKCECEKASSKNPDDYISLGK